MCVCVYLTYEKMDQYLEKRGLRCFFFFFFFFFLRKGVFFTASRSRPFEVRFAANCFKKHFILSLQSHMAYLLSYLCYRLSLCNTDFFCPRVSENAVREVRPLLTVEKIQETLKRRNRRRNCFATLSFTAQGRSSGVYGNVEVQYLMYWWSTSRLMTIAITVLLKQFEGENANVWQCWQFAPWCENTLLLPESGPGRPRRLLPILMSVRARACVCVCVCVCVSSCLSVHWLCASDNQTGCAMAWRFGRLTGMAMHSNGVMAWWMGRIHKVSRQIACGANRLARFSTSIHFVRWSSTSEVWRTFVEGKKGNNYALPSLLGLPWVLYKNGFMSIWVGPRKNSVFLIMKKHLRIDFRGSSGMQRTV